MRSGGEGTAGAAGGDGAKGDGGEHDGSADEREPGRVLTGCEQDPHGIENRLDDGDQNGLKSGDVFDGARVEPVGEAELHGAEERERDPAAGGERGGADDPREADDKREQGTADNRFDRGRILLLAQGNGHPRKTEAADHGEGIAEGVGELEAVGKEERHAAEHRGDGEPVGAGGAFAQKPYAEEGDPNGRAVLE